MSELKTKVLIAFLAIVGLWNVMKLPYFMAYGNDGNTSYSDHGVELSINLGHWVKVCLTRNISYVWLALSKKYRFTFEALTLFRELFY